VVIFSLNLFLMFDKGGIETLSITEAFGEFRYEYCIYLVSNGFYSFSVSEEVYANNSTLCIQIWENTTCSYSLCFHSGLVPSSIICHNVFCVS